MQPDKQRERERRTSSLSSLAWSWAATSKAGGRREMQTRGPTGRHAEAAGSDASRGETPRSSWDADAPAAGREAEVQSYRRLEGRGRGRDAELPTPKDAPVRSSHLPFVDPGFSSLLLSISRPYIPPNLYPSPILCAWQRTGGKYHTGTLSSTRGNDLGAGGRQILYLASRASARPADAKQGKADT